MGALAHRLLIVVATVAATISGAIGIFVVLPVNRLVDRSLVGQADARAGLALDAIRASSRIHDPDVRVYASLADLGRPLHGFRPGAADWAARGRPGYARHGRIGRRAYSIRSTGEGRLLLAALDRGGAIERRERIGLLLALLVGGTAAMVWALWAGGAYARRLGRVAGVARRVAGGDFSARGELRGRDELAGLGHDVDRMAARLGALERARQEFVAKISHDLRTPLTIIKGYAYTLERRADAIDDRQRLAAIGRESDRLATLVDDLLTLSSAGAGALRMTIAPLDVEALLAEVEERVRPFADERGVSLSVRQSATRPVEGDRRRLAQVLTNLATNAIRHTPTSGAVVIGAADAVDDEAVELTCTDTGSGIDPAAVPQLLRPFEHGDGPGSGSGLGLAIVAELVQAHGAELEFEAAPGGGTVARVILPVAAALAMAAPS